MELTSNLCGAGERLRDSARNRQGPSSRSVCIRFALTVSTLPLGLNADEVRSDSRAHSGGLKKSSSFSELQKRSGLKKSSSFDSAPGDNRVGQRSRALEEERRWRRSADFTDQLRGRHEIRFKLDNGNGKSAHVPQDVGAAREISAPPPTSAILRQQIPGATQRLQEAMALKLHARNRGAEQRPWNRNDDYAMEPESLDAILERGESVEGNSSPEPSIRRPSFEGPIPPLLSSQPDRLPALQATAPGKRTLLEPPAKESAEDCPSPSSAPSDEGEAEVGGSAALRFEENGRKERMAKKQDEDDNAREESESRELVVDVIGFHVMTREEADAEQKQQGADEVGVEEAAGAGERAAPERGGDGGGSAPDSWSWA